MPENSAADQRRADLGRVARDPRQTNFGPQARGRSDDAERPPPPRRPAPAREVVHHEPPDDDDAAAESKDDDAKPADHRGSDHKESDHKKSDHNDSDQKKGDAKGKDGKGKDDKGKDDKEKDDKEGDDAEKKPSPLSKPWVKPLIAVVVLLALIAGGIWLYRWWTHGRYVESTNNAYLQADQVTVSAKVSGTVEQVFVADNQEVHVGDPLVKIDASGNRARVDQALAQAAQARANIAQVEAQIGEQEAAIAQASAAVQGAESQRRYAQGEVDRYEPLARSGSEPAQKLSQMVANRDQAVATLRQNQAQTLQARRRILTLRAQIGLSQAQLAQAEAVARQAQIDVESSFIRANADGRVGDRQVRVGLEAQVGTRLLTIVPVQSIYLVANFKETQIGLMRVGQPASIKVDALNGMALQGTVDSFSPATGASFALIPANNATGNFTKIVQRVPVRIRIEAGDEARKVLVPGLSVEVSVDTLGSKGDVAQRKEEAKDTKEERKQETQRAIDRDRQQPASGAGR